jgi:serine protease AprX
MKKLDPRIQSYFIRKKEGLKHKKVKVIVQFTKKPCVNVINKMNNRLQISRIQKMKKLQLINAISARISRKTIGKLCRCNFIKKLTLDGKKKMHLNYATPTVGATQVQRSGWTGKNIGIAILDTGVYPHPDLVQPTNRIVAFKDYVKHKKKPYDDNGHGTHCAGDAIGNGMKSKGKYTSPAPEANLIAVKVLDREGNGYDSNIIEAIQWCVQNKQKYGIRIISLSLGGKAELSYKQDPVCQALEEARKRGIVTVASAGNSGPKTKTIDSPGISPYVVTVGATDDRNQVNPKKNKITKYSSRGPTIDRIVKPDLVAPGSKITSLRSPYSYLDRKYKKKRVGKWYTKMTGTSMSVPIVAGVIAQILENNPRLTPNEIKEILKSSAIPLGSNPNKQGSGVVNIRFLT